MRNSAVQIPFRGRRGRKQLQRPLQYSSKTETRNILFNTYLLLRVAFKGSRDVCLLYRNVFIC